MIYAIPSTDSSKEAMMDERFGRCRVFCLYDTDSGNTSFLENPAASAPEGVGPRVAEFLAGHQVGRVYSLEVGPKAGSILKKLGIEVNIVEKRLKVSELIQQTSTQS